MTHLQITLSVVGYLMVPLISETIVQINNTRNKDGVDGVFLTIAELLFPLAIVCGAMFVFCFALFEAGAWLVKKYNKLVIKRIKSSIEKKAWDRKNDAALKKQARG
jgi:hypothetical protein